MVGVIEDLVPVALREANGELVGVEGRTRGQGENLAGVGVHRNDSADLAVERLFSSHLEVEVDGELEILPRHGERLAEVADLFAVAVDDRRRGCRPLREAAHRRSPRRRSFPTTSPGW